MQSLTSSIWRTLIQTGDTRAVYLSDICRKLAVPLKGQRYLDIGAGTLVNALVFGKDYDSTYCVDLKKPRKDFTSRTGLVFGFGNAQALPFKDATFDLVSLISVVEHVEDQQQTIDEAFRV